jgi:hypothetical protein
MNLAVVQRILGLLLMLFSLTMLPPVAVSLLFQDGNWRPFVDAFMIVLACRLHHLVAEPSRAPRAAPARRVHRRRGVLGRAGVCGRGAAARRRASVDGFHRCCVRIGVRASRPVAPRCSSVSTSCQSRSSTTGSRSTGSAAWAS